MPAIGPTYTPPSDLEWRLQNALDDLQSYKEWAKGRISELESHNAWVSTEHDKRATVIESLRRQIRMIDENLL